jgi:hypothetical protein
VLTTYKSHLQAPSRWRQGIPSDPVAAAAFEAHLLLNQSSLDNRLTVWTIIGLGAARKARMWKYYGLNEKHEVQEAVIKVFHQWGYDMAFEEIRRAHGRFRK